MGKIKNVYGYLSISISESNMAKVMYAIIITRGKLVNCHHLCLERYTRRQNSGNYVDIVLELKEGQIGVFEELSGFELKTSEEFQGRKELN